MKNTERNEIIVKSQTEAEFSAQVEGLLNLYGWRWCHFRPARVKDGWRTALSGIPGFPDYIAARDGVLIFFELKRERGQVKPWQREWLEDLKACGQRVYLWRPSNWEEIVNVLDTQTTEKQNKNKKEVQVQCIVGKTD